MNIDFSLAPWGMAFAALMFLMGNCAWTNHFVRQKPWRGWLIWGLTVPVIILLGAIIELRLSGRTDSIWFLITSVNFENHWIITTLYMLMSIPGSASVLFRQSVAWTRLATIATALIILIPLGSQLQDPNDPRLALSLGITLGLCGILWIWSSMLDSKPAYHRKTVPVEEMMQ